MVSDGTAGTSICIESHHECEVCGAPFVMMLVSRPGYSLRTCEHDTVWAGEPSWALRFRWFWSAIREIAPVVRKAELIEALEDCAGWDEEEGHVRADRLLVDYVDDAEVRKAYEAIRKWYG